MPKERKLFSRGADLRCGAHVTIEEKSYGWENQDCSHSRVIIFTVTDPNQNFGDDEYNDMSTVGIAVTRKALPGLIRLLRQTYKRTREVRE